MSLAHLTLPTRDVDKTAQFFEKTLGCTRSPVPGNSPVEAVWLDIGRGQQMHVFYVAGFEVAPGARRPARPSAWQNRPTSARTTGGEEVRVEVDGEGHPGYLATARMLGEAGLMLAEPGLTPDRAGCLTPATALGTGSLERFERARLRFSVSD